MTAPSVRKAVVLLSGGLDSATALAACKNAGYEIYALSFRYGQRHAVELQAARKLARRLGVKEHRIAKIDLSLFGASSLTSHELPVPKLRKLGGFRPEIPNTYVPARNTIFLSYALAWAEVLAAQAIVLGINAVDYSGYPDCRPEYLHAFQRLADLATATGVQGRGVALVAPLLTMSKAEIIRLGQSLRLDYSLTRSCYDPAPDGAACGECDACRLRLRGFEQNGLTDPAPYVRKEAAAHPETGL